MPPPPPPPPTRAAAQRPVAWHWRTLNPAEANPRVSSLFVNLVLPDQPGLELPAFDVEEVRAAFEFTPGQQSGGPSRAPPSVSSFVGPNLQQSLSIALRSLKLEAPQLAAKCTDGSIMAQPDTIAILRQSFSVDSFYEDDDGLARLM